MKKSLLLMMVLIVVLTTALTGCGSKNEEKNANAGTNETPVAEEPKAEEPAAVEPFTVSLRHIQIGENQKFRKAILDDVVKATEAEIPGLKFELDGVEDSVNRFTKLPAEMAAGNPPKVFDLFGGAGDAIKYAKAGRLLDLTPIVEELGIKDKFLNLNQFVLDGKIYGLPIGGSTEGVFYNKTLFEKFAIAEPKTFEELEAAAEILKKNGITPFAMGSKGAWVPLMFVNTLLGRYAGPDVVDGLPSGARKWTEPEVTAAFAKYKEWEEKGYFTKGELGLDYDQMLNQFTTSKAGMMFDGSWRSSTFKDEKLAGDLLNKVGYVSLPGVPNGKGDQTFVNGNYSNGYGFSADLSESELAAVKAFIKNLFNEETQLRGLLEDNLLPSMKLSDDKLAKVEDPIVKIVTGIMAASGGAFSHFDSTVQSEVYKESEAQIQKLIAGKVTPEEVSAALQKAQDAAIAKQ